VSYDGTLLTIEAETGETFYFDAETRAFTDGGGNPVPTDTAQPTVAPLPTLDGTPPPFPTDTATAMPAPSAIGD
jgi:hypothetical protein